MTSPIQASGSAGKGKNGVLGLAITYIRLGLNTHELYNFQFFTSIPFACTGVLGFQYLDRGKTGEGGEERRNTKGPERNKIRRGGKRGRHKNK